MPPPLGVWFPPAPAGRSDLDAHLAGGGELQAVCCPVCGRRGALGGFSDNLRESGMCPRCGSWTRIRQLAAVAIEVLCDLGGRQPAVALSQLDGLGGLAVYNTEARGPVHDVLDASPTYVASEYFGPELRSGESGPNGVLHQDLQDLSFSDASFHLVLSTDVLEHVPDPYRAHQEIARVLRPGGHHVFTVPFDEAAALDDVRARLDADGTVQLHAEPLYHNDPVRPEEGALVYTIFGLEMIVKLARLGMTTTVYRLRDPSRGLVGGGGVVFDSVKDSAPGPRTQP